MEKDETQESPKLKVLPGYFCVSHPKNCDTSSFHFMYCRWKKTALFLCNWDNDRSHHYTRARRKASTCNIKCQALDVHLWLAFSWDQFSTNSHAQYGLLTSCMWPRMLPFNEYRLNYFHLANGLLQNGASFLYKETWKTKWSYWTIEELIQ